MGMHAARATSSPSSVWTSWRMVRLSETKAKLNFLDRKPKHRFDQRQQFVIEWPLRLAIRGPCGYWASCSCLLAFCVFGASSCLANAPIRTADTAAQHARSTIFRPHYLGESTTPT